MRRLVFGLAVVAGLAACGGGHHSAPVSRPAASDVPHGFTPETAARVGAHDLWVLGDYRCAGTWCLALLRSRDGGSHFERVGLPPFPAQGTDASIDFANARDGFAFVGFGSPLYATHDGGKTWQRTGPRGDVLSFAIGGRNAYDAFGRNQLARLSISGGSWHPLRVPFSATTASIRIAARGARLWLIGTHSSRHPRYHSKLGRSDDRGATFTSGSGPCFPGLGGTLVPAGRGVVWAVCPSGMLAGLFRSTNDGRSFAIRSVHDPGGLNLPALSNAAQIVATSPRSAILDGGGGGPLYRTSDVGSHWHKIKGSAHFGQILWLDFTTQRLGLAVAQRNGVRARLWRTTDSGASWHVVPLR